MATIKEIANEFLKSIGKKNNIKSNTCYWCGKKIDIKIEFRDELSKKEYEISHFCQKCQDETFGY